MTRIALIALALASPVLLIAMLSGGDRAGLVFALVAPVVPVALMALGDEPRAAVRPARVAWLLALWVVLETGSFGVLAFAGSGATLWWGLPLSTVWMLVVLGLSTLILVPVGYAWLWREPPGDRSR